MTHPEAARPLRTLDEQRREFAQRRGLVMPLVGVAAWSIVGVSGIFLPPGLEAKQRIGNFFSRSQDRFLKILKVFILVCFRNLQSLIIDAFFKNRL